MPPPTTGAGPHVAVLAFPFGTHAGPLLAVVDRLAALSPATHFSFLSTPQSNASAFKNRPSADASPPANVRAHDVWDGIPEGYELTGRHQEAIELFMSAAPAGFRQGIAAAEAESGRKVSCLVTDAFYWFAAEMAEELRAPWVGFWTAGPNALSAHLYTDRLREALGNVPAEAEEAQLGSIVLGMSKIRVKDLPEGVVTGNLTSIFSTMLHNMSTHLPKSAAAVFINSFRGLDPTITDDLASRFTTFLNIGPFHLLSPPPPPPNSSSCLPWLDGPNLAPASVAYVSFGSVVTPPPHEIRAVAESLEATRVPFLWSLRDHARAHLPQGFAERSQGQGQGMVVPWAPQVEVLGHGAVGVFVTHCGWNSVLESIAGGVPMICRPFFGDQRLNGRMIEDVWGIGVNLEGGVFSKEGLVGCLDRVLKREEGKRMRENVGVLKEKAEEATKPKGSSSDDFCRLVELVSTTTMP
ncbi:unnamed protein product [Linum tenue]|uniref:Glycosyltransferase n=1 Tax=Linum tenue TaxID=586396 RepID=A0AAV0RSY6_9ROSI|nr:unnamed protein product [Linum tenue]